MEGSKRWYLRTQPELQAPLLGFTPHYEATGNLETQTKVAQAFNGCDLGTSYSKERLMSESTEIVLNEGDIMYHPAGIWHKVESVSDSVSINFSLRQVRWAELICNALRMQLLNNTQLR